MSEPSAAGGRRQDGTRPRGRRADGSAVEDILAAARAEFAERGYGGTSVRGVARRAHVDPGLVRYYFGGGKPELFAMALARREIDPAGVVATLVADGLDGLGARLLDVVVGTWDAPGGRERFRMVIAATASGQDHLVRDFLASEVFGRVRAALPAPDADLRVGLVASHLVGVLVTRYVLELEPVASAPREELVALVGPTLQRYLTGELPGA
ncbi:TetR family transcriptional regulator [Actinotalea ferrariae]|uniref:TetR/AcrR family transcriptional regulator n=1 Tax=Actinotalea ferrariae TaxID=1386098 RepID=UPI001C8B9209|nr:TetR family transcriptional regulator [Actinotalea ferrariae]MBX9244587.1 TetR family transcriptional regulator [Actinotalea ferrariae]